MNVFVRLLTSILSCLYKLASTNEAFERPSAPLDVVEKQNFKADYFTNYRVRIMRKTRLQKMAWIIPLLFLVFAARGQDLSVGVQSSATTATIGGQLTFKIIVRNDAHTAVTGVELTAPIPTGTTYVSDNGAGAYNSATGVWTVGAIGAAIDSVVLNVVVQVTTEGVIFSQAEVTAMTGTDGDSTPNNGSVTEDDWGSACATVPIHYNCRDDINALATAPSGYTTYQWYKNGSLISGANKDTYRIKEIGNYNFTAATLTTFCPASLCCPLTIVRDSCMSLGNLVFEDKDNNGLFNGTDAGLNGIVVELHSLAPGGAKGDASDKVNSTITTANGGLYVFNNLNPGLYYVKLTGGGIPTKYVSSTGGGPNDYATTGTYEPGTRANTDNADHGSQMGVMVMSDLVTLTLNGEPTSEDGSANTNLTVDFGLYKPTCVLPDIAATSPAAICFPNTIDVATILVTDASTIASSSLTYFGSAMNAVDSLSPLSSTVIASTQQVWIRKTNLVGRCFDTVSVYITINLKPVYADGSITVCAPANVDLTSLITGYASIVNPIWKSVDVLTGSIVATPTNVTPSVSTTYFLIGENASGCKDTAEVVVTVTPKPNLGADQTLTCSGITTPTTYDFGTTGTWRVLSQPAAAAVVTGSGAVSNMTISGQYSFEIIVNGCKDTAIITVQGCIPTLSLGNLVFEDKDNNGVFNSTDVGIKDVRVVLYDVGVDGLKGTADDVKIDSVLTNNTGGYLFTGLVAGDYYVKLSSGIPTGMVSSTGDGPADRDGVGAFEPSTEGDVNDRDHGTQMGNMVMSNIINLTINGEPINDGDNDPNTNLTVDFGLYAPVDTGIFDLALIKKLVPRRRGAIVNNGDTVRFRMTVINQGTANAYDIKIVDYVPKGLLFYPNLNISSKTGNLNDWAADSTLLVGNLKAGKSITADIILVVNHGSRDTFFLNKSEVIFATNTEGSLTNTPDIDSQADSNPNNDHIGGDNVVDNSNGDEDDHDYAFVIDYPDKDPIGYIYCDKTGKIVMGGMIDVQGPGLVYIIEDGSNGRYQFFTDGTPGTYTLTYSHPDGFPMSTICAPRADTLDFATADGSIIDRDGIVNDTIEVGTGGTADGYLTDKSCANNPYYLNFYSSSNTEPIVLHNNLPIQCSFIGALAYKDNNYNSLIDAGDTQFDSVKVYLYNCLTNAILDSTLSIRGKYRFDGLRSGSYKVRALLPNGFRYSIGNISGNPFVDSRLDSAGYSACINLNFGECDTLKGNVCFIPQIFDLALRKTLAGGQAPTVNVGDTVNFNIQVFNQGTMTAYDVDIADYIPTGMQLVDSSWTSNGSFASKRLAGPIPFSGNLSTTIKLKVTGTAAQQVNFAEISRASDRPGGANVPDIDSQADSIPNNDRGGRVSVVGEDDNINGGLNGDEDDSDPAVINVNNPQGPCGVALNPDFTTRGFCALGATQFTAKTGFRTYAWNFGDGTTAGNLQLVNHTYTTPTGGNYTVTLVVTNADGCTDSIKKQVIINPMVWANAGVDQYICKGDSVQLSAQGGTHYNWLADATLSNTGIFNPIATPSVSTTYVVVVSNDYGCAGTDTVTVFVNPEPVIVSRTGSVSTCSNGVMPVRIQLNQPIASYRITGSAGYSNVVINGSVITFDATLNGALNNMCVALTGNGGCTVKDTFNLYLAGNPTADFVVIEPFCNNAETTILFTGTSSPAAILTYNLGDGVIVRRSAATATRPYGDTTVVIFPTFGSKILKLNVNDGGCQANTTKSIFVRKSPRTVLANRDTTICPSVCVPLYGTAGIFDCIYQWSPATGLSSTNTPYTTACPTITTTYTLTIIDVNGCSSSASVKIFVTPPPVLVGVPTNVTAECNNIPRAATVTAYYLNANGVQVPVTVVFNEVKTAGNCPNSYTLTRTWTATNNCNVPTTGTQVITVQDVTSPILAGVPLNLTLSCDVPVPSANGVTATDNCDATPLVTSIDVKTNGTCANNYLITRTWTARDACNNTSTASQTITVRDINSPMLMNVPMNTTLSCDAALPSATGVTAMDNCDAAPRVTYADVKTAGYCPQSYTLARTWTATDACGNTATASQVIIVLDLTKPVLANVPANVTIECTATIPTPPTVTATDNCDVDTNGRLYLRVVFGEKRTNTPCGYTLTRTWTAIDACGNAQTGVQVITVEDRTAPSFNNTPGTVTIDCIEKLYTVAAPSVSDACDSNPTVTLVQSVTDSTCANKKKITRLYTAKDKCGNTQLFTQTIIVNDNIAPVITPRNPLLAGFRSGDTLTMSCEDIRIFQLGDATAVDNCSGCTPALTFEDLARRRGTCSIDGYSLLMECLWKATDCCGNTSEWRIFIKVTDNQAPILRGVPANITVTSVSQIPLVPTVTATDNCTDSVGVTFSQTQVGTGQNCEYIITRTWTALDACGNATRGNQQILVRVPPLEVKAVHTDETCARNDGTITMIPSSGVTYIWSDGARGAFRTGLRAGSYTVTATAGLCEKILTVVILDGCVCPNPVVATIAKTDATCGNSNGSATVAVDNAANYNFTWSPNASAGTGASRSNLAAGTYSVTVTRSATPTCTAVVSVTVANDTANCCTTPVATITKTDATCGNSNGSATVAVDNAANYNFTWSANTPAGTGASRSNLAAGTYSITVSRIADATCLTVVTTTIANNTANCCTTPVATLTKADATCGNANGSATIAVDSAANYTFTWSANASAGTGATRTGLAAGTYSITVSRVANPTCLTVVTATIANNTEGCCNIIAQSSIIKVLQDCAGKADVCVEIAPNQLANYTITDNGTAYTGGFGTCLAGSTLSLAAGEHQLIFTNNLIANCKDTLAVKVVCVREMTFTRTVQLPATNEYCLTATALGLTGTITSIINECAASADNSKITINDTTKCVKYQGLSVGIDTACLKITTSTGDVANMRFIINVTATVCTKFIAQDSVIITNACTDSTKVCVNIPFAMIPDYSVTLNGAAYTNGFEGCRNDTALTYNYFSLPGRGVTGPYDLNQWMVNGTMFTAQNISSMQALVDTMNKFDPTGRWQLSNATYSIIGGNLRSSYGTMRVTKVSDGSFGLLEISQTIMPRATNLKVLRGRSVLVFTNRLAGCTDTVVVNAACIVSQRIENTMFKGKTDTLCIDTRQLLGTRYRISTLTSSTGQYVGFSNVLGTTCVKRSALNVGTERATYVMSDEYGMHDTVYITTHVTESALQAKRPVAKNDKAQTTKARPIYVDILTNDTIFTNKATVTIIQEPKRGTATITTNLRVLYTPNADYCSTNKPDVFRYTICNQAGCDTATAEITVLCDQIKVFTALSPNNDGVNDYFVIEGAETFSKNTLTIYNRWGNQILDVKSYKNDWAGTWNGQPIPDGTYFYIFNDGEGKTVSGYIQIQR